MTGIEWDRLGQHSTAQHSTAQHTTEIAGWFIMRYIHDAVVVQVHHRKSFLSQGTPPRLLTAQGVGCASCLILWLFVIKNKKCMYIYIYLTSHDLFFFLRVLVFIDGNYL